MKDYILYSWNIIPIAVFYALPVMQLVFSYQVMHNNTGNEDKCYYNFMCANSFGQLSAFNNVFSNTGYILLGILYLIIVRLKATYGNSSEDKKYFGLHYALGIALIMEGVLSGSYHVCPNRSNYQFDTSYMYIMVCLTTLKLFQNRHRDELASAHVTYIWLAVFAIIAVLGLVCGTLAFWIILVFVHIGASCILTCLYYNEGHWRRPDENTQNADEKVVIGQTILIVVVNLFNLSAAIAAAVVQPDDFETYLLGVLMINSGLYFLFYIIMKPVCGECYAVFSVLWFFVAIGLWIPAWIYFRQGLTRWETTPAISREGNKDCSWFDFYDDHDIWHFLSAGALFFTFLTLLTIDDNLDGEGADDIAKF
ncbi:SID1 transmembrane family member 1-like [Ptychodera flava]|uniref:SID1 transmembrane family member 1-like n=1 Tax=Ptychodera flava TaxID=63121 RepID=UPI00396A2CBD